MLSLPCIVERNATPYVALSRYVVLPFDDEMPDILARLSAYLAQRGLPATGPLILKHNVVDMPRLQMEFAVPMAHPAEAEGEFTSDVLPAGRHAEISYTGPYDDLVTVNAVLIGWARHAGLVFDSRHQRDGEWFAHRSEICHIGPAEWLDQRELRTTVTIKLKDP
ncbi:GyrI-like domain-containing protein [Luteimonas sp. SDU82]|uniref:GyrI-like domain-containing protein n=1 Tax=Luteimonas sp. SDU82 TaxID=3422592 RepID=UPI003EB72BE7